MNMYESIKNNLNEYEKEDITLRDFEDDDESLVGETKSSVGIYVGDPCYVMYDDVYDNVWGEKYGYSDGVIESDKGTFVVHGTAYGDGEYGYTYSFPVDSGTIAIVPGELVDFENKVKNSDINSYGHYFPGATMATLSYIDGVFRIKVGGEKPFLIYTDE